ncbi:hypothetical protein [Bartonella machadoae]|uniref:hypothetical protein n=1 Tax=Bartonella machadoae TaxID=2893471 RepID=UPI001F4C70A5|nr:hypothetical protein [Bartonella machadoae]UNE53939.1 hypothetical protein LNM86_10195 [Bartonella machadoae]
MKKKNATSYKGRTSFSCKRSLVFSWENYKVILQSFFIMLCAFPIMMALNVPAYAKTTIQTLQGWSGVGYVIFLLPVFIWLCILTPFPILWGIHSMRERKLKKTMQQEEATKQQDEAVRG